MSANLSDAQTNINPNSLANLRLWQPGESGNPGGRLKGAAKISSAYDRLLILPDAEFKKFKPTNQAEKIAYQRIKEALQYETNHALGAAKEITNRTEGRPAENLDEARKNREVLVFSLILIARLDGREIDRGQAIEEIESETRKLVNVQEEALQLAEAFLAQNS